MTQYRFVKQTTFWVIFVSVALFLSACKPDAKKGQAKAVFYPLSIESVAGEVRANFEVERALTRSEQEIGLMNRESMSDKNGMIFVYPSPARVFFWMKNTLIPLDMIFISPAGEVVHIHKNAIPHDETPISSGAIVRSALEINAGLVEKYGISVGDKVIFHNYQ